MAAVDRTTLNDDAIATVFTNDENLVSGDDVQERLLAIIESAFNIVDDGDQEGGVPVIAGGKIDMDFIFGATVSNDRIVITSGGVLNMADVIPDNSVIFADGNGIPDGDADFNYIAGSKTLTIKNASAGSTATPSQINFGDSYASTERGVPRIKLFDDAVDWYGIGGTETNMEIVMFDTGGSISFYVGESGTAADDIRLSINTTRIGSNVPLYRNGVQILNTRVTGWTAATGAASRTTFDANWTLDADASYMEVQLQEAIDKITETRQKLKAVIDDLIAHGLIGA